MWATVTVAVTGIVVLGVPLAFVARMTVRNDALRRLDREASAVAFTIDDDLEHQRVIDRSLLGALAGRDREIVLRESNGRVVRGGDPLPTDTLSGTVRVERHGTVTVLAGAGDTDRRVVAAVLLIAGLSALGIAAAICLAMVVARRLERPVAELARVSERLGAGDFSIRAPRSGVPELDAMAAALDQSAARIDELVQAERDFTTNASHQLRTPLTALVLRIEELTNSDDPDVQREAEAALRQADRLGTTIEDLLALARDHAAAQRRVVDVAALVRDRVVAWQATARRAHRRIDVVADTDCVVDASAPALAQAIDALIDNAIRHGGGIVRVGAHRRRHHVEVTVDDEGHGIPPDAVSSVFERHISLHGGTGVGLALARSLVEASGGRLELARAQPASFQILLPTRADQEESVSPSGARI
jgi:signal transduction histidine kinase